MVDVLLWSMLEMWSLYIFWVNITVIKYQAFMHLNQTIPVEGLKLVSHLPMEFDLLHQEALRLTL